MANNLNGNWTKIPNWILDLISSDKYLTKNEIKILLRINREQYGFQNQECFSGTPNKLAQKSGVKWLVLTEALETLKNKGLIEIISLNQTSPNQTSPKRTNRLVQIRLVQNGLIDSPKRTNPTPEETNNDNGLPDRKETIYKETINKETIKDTEKPFTINDSEIIKTNGNENTLSVDKKEIDTSLITKKLKESKYLKYCTYMTFATDIYAFGQEIFIEAVDRLNSAPLTDSKKVIPYFKAILKNTKIERENIRNLESEPKENPEIRKSKDDEIKRKEFILKAKRLLPEIDNNIDRINERLPKIPDDTKDVIRDKMIARMEDHKTIHGGYDYQYQCMETKDKPLLTDTFEFINNSKRKLSETNDVDLHEAYVIWKQCSMLTRALTAINGFFYEELSKNENMVQCDNETIDHTDTQNVNSNALGVM